MNTANLEFELRKLKTNSKLANGTLMKKIQTPVFCFKNLFLRLKLSKFLLEDYKNRFKNVYEFKIVKTSSEMFYGII